MSQIEPPYPLEGRWQLELLPVASEWTDNMDDPRGVQTSKRNGSSRSFLSAGSAVAMEIKRKKIRQSTLFLQTEVWTKHTLYKIRAKGLTLQSGLVCFAVNTESQ